MGVIGGMVCLFLAFCFRLSAGPTPPPQQLWYPEHLGQMLMLTPAQFEAAVANLLHRCGYRNLMQVGGAGDLGADLIGESPDGRKVVVQCKRYAPGARVGSPAVQSFIGMMIAEHHAGEGMFVTTSEFSGPAIELASRHGVELIDGVYLSRLIERVCEVDRQQVSA